MSVGVALGVTVLLGLAVEYQLVIRGLVILAAVAFYSANWSGFRRKLTLDRSEPVEGSG